MPRLIEEKWVGIGFDITIEQTPKTHPANGQPLYDENGLPLTEEVTTLVLIVPLPDGQRIIRIPFSPESKQELLRKLTGGIVVPNGNISAPHLPFGKGV